jgi:hypothetical protein
MAIEVRHTCSEDENDYVLIKAHPDGGFVDMNGMYQGEQFAFCFDISTAIRLSKSIRTEINKAKLEVDNG